MNVPEPWREAAAALAGDPFCRLIYVVGETSTGKTTLCRFLLEELRQNSGETGCCAYVDGDPGQSVLGPPGSLGLVLYSPLLQQSERRFLKFVGSTSPDGQQLPTATAIKRLVDKALESGAGRILLDSSGYVVGPQAHEFQVSLIDLLQPDCLVALQKGVSVQRLLAAFRRRPKLRLLQLPVCSAAVEKSAAQRRSHRRERFASYLHQAADRTIGFRGLGLLGRVPDLRSDRRSDRNLLCALNDREGFALSIGLLRELDPDRGTLKLYAPPFDPGEVATIQFGSIYVDENGEELAPGKL